MSDPSKPADDTGKIWEKHSKQLQKNPESYPDFIQQHLSAAINSMEVPPTITHSFSTSDPEPKKKPEPPDNNGPKP